MGVGVDAGADSHQNILTFTLIGANLLQEVQFVEVVHNDATDAGAHRLLQLARRLIAAVEVDYIERHFARHGHGQFASGHNIQTQAFLGEDANQRRVDARFGSVHDPGIGVAPGESAGELSAAVAQCGLVQDVQWSPVLFGQLHGIAAAQGKMAGTVRIRRVGEDVRKLAQHRVIVQVYTRKPAAILL